MPRQSPLAYLNTDLELYSTARLTPLLRELRARGLFSLRHDQAPDGGWIAWLEWEGEVVSPEQTLLMMIHALETLPPAAAKMANACKRRIFNIGYQCGGSKCERTESISNETLSRIALQKAELQLTLYPSPEPLVGPNQAG